MIYTLVGLKGNMDELDGISDDFEYVVNRKAKRIKASADGESIKERQVNFIAGTLTERASKGNRYLRSNYSLINRTLIVLDFDKISMDAETFKQAVHAGLAEFSYYLYPTKSHTPENPRYRLIVKPERNFIQAEHKPLIREIESRIGIKTGDNANETWSQMNGLPVAIGITEDDFRASCVVNHGEPYPINVEIIEDEPESTHRIEIVKSIPDELSHAIMKNYVSKEAFHLHDRANYLSALMVIVNATQTGEISIEDGKLFSEMLACGNPEWAENNINDFERELRTTVRTDKTFMQKFNFKNDILKEVRNMGAEAREYMKSNVIAMKPAKEKKMTTLECALYLMQYHTFKLLSENDNTPLAMYLPDEGIYSVKRNPIERLIVSLGDYNQRETNEIIFKIASRVDVVETEKNPDLIPVANGIYNRKTHTLLPFIPERVFTSKVATKWTENAPKPSWDVDVWLESIANNDKDVVTLLWQIIAECLNGNYTRGKFFMIVGSGNNGKGTFQDLLKHLIGINNVSTLNMEQIGERFSPSLLVGKVLNIGDDISSSTLPNVQNLLSITTGDSITVEEKGKQGYSVTLTTGMLFSANEIPRASNKTNGLYRRMQIVPFLADFNGGVEDKSIRNEKIKRSDVLEYVLHKALKMDFEDFIQPAITEKYKLDYKKDNDPIFEFYSDEWLDSEMSNLDRVPTKYVYEKYIKFCEDNGYRHESNRKFTLDMLKFMNGTHENKPQRISVEFRAFLADKYGDYKTAPYEKGTIKHYIKK